MGRVWALELLHEVLPDRPHARTLAVNVHGNRKQHATELYTADSDESILGTAGRKPVGEEQRENESVKNV
jgi:hypothetical protein